MASAELDIRDAPACPVLGLAVDRRTHYTFPHPGHRCFATQPPGTTGPDRQSAYCLTAGFDACDRFRVFQRRPAAGAPLRPPTASGAPFTLSLIHISEPTRLGMISYAVFCLKTK